MDTYTCTNRRPIEAESAREAAGLFAQRIAGRGYAIHSVRPDSWSADHTCTTWTAIAVRSGGAFRNINFTTHAN
jgi:hypothetical protein